MTKKAFLYDGKLRTDCNGKPIICDTSNKCPPCEACTPGCCLSIVGELLEFLSVQIDGIAYGASNGPLAECCEGLNGTYDAQGYTIPGCTTFTPGEPCSFTCNSAIGRYNNNCCWASIDYIGGPCEIDEASFTMCIHKITTEEEEHDGFVVGDIVLTAYYGQYFTYADVSKKIGENFIHMEDLIGEFIEFDGTSFGTRSCTVPSRITIVGAS